MLKPLSEALQPDPVFHQMIAEVTEGGVRHMTFEDHYDDVAGISLTKDIPAAVRDAFERAQHSYLYGWFYFDLTKLAQAQAYAALEAALRLTLGPKIDGNPWTGIGELLGIALSRGLFDGLSRQEHDVGLSLTDRLKHLFQTIQTFRTHLANGTSVPEEIGAPLNALRDCANIINHLFRLA